MINSQINLYSGTANQKGAALIISLMMLVVMTILAVSAVTTTTMEEKMAGNMRNKHMSFQAAEAAMRAAETIVEGLSDDSAYDGTNGIYSRSTYGDSDFPIWDPLDGSVANWQDITTNTGTAQSPQFIIENFGTSYRDADCALIVPLPPGCELPVFRITTRGWGLRGVTDGNTNGDSMIQATYKQL